MRTSRFVKVQPLTESGLSKFQDLFIEQNWDQVFKADSAHEKAQIFQDLILSKFNECFPHKMRKINSDDQPWVTHKVKLLDRKRKRLYHKERRSENWKKADKLFKEEVKSAKSVF